MDKKDVKLILNEIKKLEKKLENVKRTQKNEGNFEVEPKNSKKFMMVLKRIAEFVENNYPTEDPNDINIDASYSMNELNDNIKVRPFDVAVNFFPEYYTDVLADYGIKSYYGANLIKIKRASDVFISLIAHIDLIDYRTVDDFSDWDSLIEYAEYDFLPM